MDWSGNLWNQIKNKTCDELVSALKKDGWDLDTKSGAVHVYYHYDRKKRITIHYHPKKTYQSAKLLKGIINDIGWNEDDLRRLKLIK